MLATDERMQRESSLITTLVRGKEVRVIGKNRSSLGDEGTQSNERSITLFERVYCGTDPTTLDTSTDRKSKQG